MIYYVKIIKKFPSIIIQVSKRLRSKTGSVKSEKYLGLCIKEN